MHMFQAGAYRAHGDLIWSVYSNALIAWSTSVACSVSFLRARSTRGSWFHASFRSADGASVDQVSSLHFAW